MTKSVYCCRVNLRGRQGKEKQGKENGGRRAEKGPSGFGPNPDENALWMLQPKLEQPPESKTSTIHLTKQIELPHQPIYLTGSRLHVPFSVKADEMYNRTLMPIAWPSHSHLIKSSSVPSSETFHRKSKFKSQVLRNITCLTSDFHGRLCPYGHAVLAWLGANIMAPA